MWGDSVQMKRQDNPSRSEKWLTPSEIGIYRKSGCRLCGKPIDNERHNECRKCGWIKCKCGTCGCGYKARSGVSSNTPATPKKTTEVREVLGVGDDTLKDVSIYQKRIKQAFARLAEREDVEMEKVEAFFQGTLSEVKKEFADTIYFFDLIWLVASEIKDLMEVKTTNAHITELAQRLRNQWIRFVPGNLYLGGKSFWGLSGQEWSRLKNNG